MSGINCHFVSRFLTRPWEGTNRLLHYYAFGDRSINEAPSRHLFAERDANTADTEARLNQYLETPIAAAIAGLTGVSTEGAIALSDPELFRALMLLFPLQPIRSRSAENHAQLSEVLKLSPAEIDHVAHEGAKRFKPVRVRASAVMPMFYPERGFFPLPVPAAGGGFVAAPTIPLTPEFAVALVPLDCNLTELSQLWKPGLVSNFSVDLRSPRVVLHPALLEKDRSELVHAIEEAREDSVAHFALCTDANGVLAKLNSM